MTIFSTFLNGHIKDFDPKLADVAFQNKVIQAALELHDKVSKAFRKTAANFHYEFSIRHLANVFKGLLMSDSVCRLGCPKSCLRYDYVICRKF